MPAGGVWPVPLQEEGSPEAFRAPGTVHYFAQDRQIFAGGDAVEHLYRVVSGVVRACKFLSDGRRQIESFYVAGDVFGLEAGMEYSLSAEAVTDCTVVAFRRKAVDALAQKDAALALQLMIAMMQALAQARSHALLLGRRGAAEKVASFLTEWASHSSCDGLVNLAMTRQDVADYLGLTIETVSRTLTQLERDHLIALPNTRQIRLCNRAALESLVD
jgi:CRP/FNR family nitrogen fixation transcriptional regulator